MVAIRKIMTANYEITQLRNGLRVCVRKDMRLWGRIFISALFAVMAQFITDRFIGNWSWVIALVVAIGAFATVRGSAAELRATNVELVARGSFGRRGSRITRVVCTGDVRRLEFRDVAAQNGGLYAVTARSAHFILPLVDYAETMEIIRAIEARFPGLAEGWHSESPSGDHFLTLGLGSMK
jgi:hypothetical protein